MTFSNVSSCQMILTGTPPGPGDSHGCPYRHYSEQQLTNVLLGSYRIANAGETKEILDSTRAGHYHVACTRVFELTHKDLGVKKGDGFVTVSVVVVKCRTILNLLILAGSGTARACRIRIGTLRSRGTCPSQRQRWIWTVDIL